jgi:hypothetical protein
MVTRRGFLRQSCCAICAATLTNSRAKADGRIFDGCAISPSGYQNFRTQNDGVGTIGDGMFARNRHWHTTGDPAMDRDLDRALAMVADLMGVNPAFGFYDPAYLHNPVGHERDAWNAFATAEATDIAGSWGTVAFSLNLFRDELHRHDPSGMSVMTIIAHEFGHIVQYRYGHQLHVGYPRKSEINADFWAGYFLGTRKRALPSLRFERAGDMMMRFGRSVNGNPTRSHGDERERLDAAEAGFRVAFVARRPFDQAMAAGLEYVK